MLREAPSIYGNAKEFFRRTYLTSSMKDAIESSVKAIKGEGNRVLILTSLFGGGKTHTLLALYHAFNSPEKLAILDKELAGKVAELGGVKVIVLDADSEKLVPHPKMPYEVDGFTIRTIWGMLAYRLGRYSEIEALDSEDSPPPSPQKIRSLLRGQKILILVDEVVKYIFNMRRAGLLRTYGERLITFLENLAKAVEDTNTALVAAVPVELKREEGYEILLAEEAYREDAQKVYRALSRVAARRITPVTVDDIAQLLRKRIFEFVLESIQTELYSVYSQYKDLFGDESYWDFVIEETGRRLGIRDTYPFHPKYIETLYEFISRSKDLQKTRDAIKITRKVVRGLWRSSEDPEFIMPWHIDLKNPDVRSYVITQSYRAFDHVLNKDLVSPLGALGNVKKCSKPELALNMATFVFLKTYTYEAFKEAIKPFPTLYEVALATYEPSFFANYKLQPADIRDVLAEMERNLVFLQTDGERYWFTLYPSAIEYAEKRAEELLRARRIELYAEVKKLAEGILFPSATGRGGRAEVPVRLFNRNNCIVIGYGDFEDPSLLVKDDGSVKLVVFAKPGVDEEEVKRVVLNYGDRSRNFKNTIVVVYADPNRDFEQEVLKFVAKYKGAEVVLRELEQYYADKDIRKVQEKRLKRYINDNRESAQRGLLSLLTRVAFPTDRGVGFVDAVPGSSIATQVEAALTRPEANKFKENLTFTDVVEFLKSRYGRDIVNGDKFIEFRQVYEYFLTNPAAPMLTKNMLVSSIRDGLRRLDIGIKHDGKLYWKRIGESGAEEPSVIGDYDEILPFKLAAEEFARTLLEEEGEFRTEKELKVVRYVVDVAGQRTYLKDLVEMKDYEKVLKSGIVLREEKLIEEDFYVRLDRSLVEANPGSRVNIKVTVVPVGVYAGEVELKVSEGEVNPFKGRPEYDATWSFIAPQEPGEYKLEIVGVDASGKTVRALLRLKVKAKEEIIEVDEVGDEHIGARLIEIVPMDFEGFDLAYDVMERLGVPAIADIDISIGEQVSFSAKEVELIIARRLLSKVVEGMDELGLRDKAAFSGSIRLSEEVELDVTRVYILKILSGKAGFKLAVPRK